MKVLITGGAGFVGSNLCHYLAEAGNYDVCVIDNLSAGQVEHQLPSGVRITIGDFTDRATISECLRGIDAVIHLAALSGVIDSIEDPRPSFRVNVEGSFQLLELARSAKVKTFINASTGGALLGDVTPPITEDMAPSPLSPYGASKLAVEGYCSAFSGSYGLPCTTLRFSNLYGPRSAHKKSVVAAFIKQIIRNEPVTVYGDGSQQRDYLYVGDLVRGIERALQRRPTGVYQLGSGLPTTLKSLMAVLEKVAGRKFEVRYEPVRSGEVRLTWCNIEKAKREFGYSAPTALEAGIRATWEWYLNNQDVWARQMALTASD